MPSFLDFRYKMATLRRLSDHYPSYLDIRAIAKTVLRHSSCSPDVDTYSAQQTLNFYVLFRIGSLPHSDSKNDPALVVSGMEPPGTLGALRPEVAQTGGIESRGLLAGTGPLGTALEGRVPSSWSSTSTSGGGSGVVFCPPRQYQ